jgi:hypothetical protein
VVWLSRVKHSSMQEYISAKTPAVYFQNCYPGSNSECEHISVATNESYHKTLSMGIIQHPGMAAVGYGVPVFILTVTSLLMSVIFFSYSIAFCTFVTYIAFLFVIGHSEFRNEAHIIMSFVMFSGVIIYHYLLASITSEWYKPYPIYRAVLVSVGIIYFAFGIMSITKWKNIGAVYVDWEIACVGFMIPLQFFASHVMLTASPVEISMRLSPACKPPAVPKVPQPPASPVGSDITEDPL